MMGFGQYLKKPAKENTTFCVGCNVYSTQNPSCTHEIRLFRGKFLPVIVKPAIDLMVNEMGVRYARFYQREIEFRRQEFIEQPHLICWSGVVYSGFESGTELIVATTSVKATKKLLDIAAHSMTYNAFLAHIKNTKDLDVEDVSSVATALDV